MNEKSLFKCDKCGKEYKTKPSYIKHIEKCDGTAESTARSVPDKRFTKPKNPKADKPVRCEICGSGYVGLKEFQQHTCVQRLMIKDTREFPIAMGIWKKACEKYRIRISTKRPVIDSFVLSHEFNVYIEFAKFLTTALIIDHDSYIDYVLSNSVPCRDWCTNKTIQEWTISYLGKEPPTDGVTRSINALQQWQSETGNEWHTVFNNMSVDRFIMWLQSGKLSPWLIYATNRASTLLSRMSESEIQAILPYINPELWNGKKMRYQDEVKKLQKVLSEVGL